MEPTSLDPTTLLTFIFRAPPEIRAVELLGSWDNFRLPYRMHHDRRRGIGFWTGCFKFENIVFDGDNLQWCRPRSGGLRQGGTYWYYYRLNYDLDAFDDRQPHTTYCPLLPGQRVNVIDVPTEIIDLPERCHSAYADIIGSLAEYGSEQTMNPDDKFRLLHPPPKSKVHKRCFSDEAVDGRLETGPVSGHDRASSSPPSSPQTQHSRPPSRKTIVRRHGDVSTGNPIFTQRSADSGIAGVLDCETDRGEADLPEFPYPSVLGPEPLRVGRPSSGSRVSRESNSVCEKPRSSGGPLTYQPTRRASQASVGPAFVRHKQFHGPRPNISLVGEAEQHRPRTHALPHLEIAGRDDEDDDDDDNSLPQSPDNDYSPTSVEDHDETPTPYDGTADYDLVSPTYTAMTISTDGQKTPVDTSGPAPVNANDHMEDEREMENITDRLKALNPTDPPQHRSCPQPFLGYSLTTLVSERCPSPGEPGPKTSDTRRPLAGPEIFQEGLGTSMAEDIFSELGFLGSSII